MLTRIEVDSYTVYNSRLQQISSLFQIFFREVYLLFAECECVLCFSFSLSTIIHNYYCSSRFVVMYNRKAACVWWVHFTKWSASDHHHHHYYHYHHHHHHHEQEHILRKTKQKWSRNQVNKESDVSCWLLIWFSEQKLCKNVLKLGIYHLSIIPSHHHVYERMNTNAFFILFPILSVILFALLAEFHSGESKWSSHQS